MDQGASYKSGSNKAMDWEASYGLGSKRWIREQMIDQKASKP